MNCFKKLALAGMTACTSLIMFAQETTGSYDFSAVNTELEKVSTAVKTWVTAALPYSLGGGEHYDFDGRIPIAASSLWRTA